jgi:hypothetical protein
MMSKITYNKAGTMYVREFSPENPHKRYAFWCEGCGSYHLYDVGNTDGHATWAFNGDFEKPTFLPSLLYTHSRCHLYVENGNIRYLADSPHSLAGKTIPLPVLPDQDLKTWEDRT